MKERFEGAEIYLFSLDAQDVLTVSLGNDLPDQEFDLT